MMPLPTAPAVLEACLDKPTPLSVFGLDYVHLRLRDGSDLYVTQWGLPFASQLLPQSHWDDQEWFAAHSAKLTGTSMLCKVRTKAADGPSKDIVLKWNRMGQDIPGETEALGLEGAQFNSPFEEFSLLAELRMAPCSFPGRLLTHKPLAIYVPRMFVEAERLGRKLYVMEALLRTHREVALDPNRQYAVIYEWIKGVDAGHALQEGLLDERTVRQLLARSNAELAGRGFRVRDGKAQHLIVRPRHPDSSAKGRGGRVLYAMVDFELLERTPQHERAVRALRRHNYLVKQARRFQVKTEFPPDLSLVNIMGVNYVYGRVETSGGALWVVGDDPGLFDYFLPEKWRKMPRKKLSASGRVYETVTKDNIHLVWRVSRVGQIADVDSPVCEDRIGPASGYNSPFEEVAISLQLLDNGVETTYPRAVYMSGHRLASGEHPADLSRYESHENILTPEGHPVLSGNHEYIVLWGYWNGPDELLATRDRDYYRPIDAQKACDEGIITKELSARLLESTRRRLARAGVDALRLTGDHILLSLDPTGALAIDPESLPRARICSFDTLRHHSR